MATALSFKAFAVAALLSVVVTYGARAQQQQPDHNATDSQDRSLLSYSSGWLPARATWYGAPTGAGPDDNGKDPHSKPCRPLQCGSSHAMSKLSCWCC